MHTADDTSRNWAAHEHLQLLCFRLVAAHASSWSLGYTLEQRLQQQGCRRSPPYQLAHCLQPHPQIPQHASTQLPFQQQMASEPQLKAFSAAAAVLDEVPQPDGLQCLCWCLEWTEGFFSAKTDAAQQSSQAAVIHVNDEAQHSQQVRPHGAAVLALGQNLVPGLFSMGYLV